MKVLSKLKADREPIVKQTYSTKSVKLVSVMRTLKWPPIKSNLRHLFRLFWVAVLVAVR